MFLKEVQHCLAITGSEPSSDHAVPIVAMYFHIRNTQPASNLVTAVHSLRVVTYCIPVLGNGYLQMIWSEMYEMSADLRNLFSCSYWIWITGNKPYQLNILFQWWKNNDSEEGGHGLLEYIISEFTWRTQPHSTTVVIQLMLPSTSITPDYIIIASPCTIPSEHPPLIYCNVWNIRFGIWIKLDCLFTNKKIHLWHKLHIITAFHYSYMFRQLDSKYRLWNATCNVYCCCNTLHFPLYPGICYPGMEQYFTYQLSPSTNITIQMSPSHWQPSQTHPHPPTSCHF
jgi:hypothetical protein